MILTPGVNIINNLHTAFTPTDPKSVKKIVGLAVFFVLFDECWGNWPYNSWFFFNFISKYTLKFKFNFAVFVIA